MAQYFSDEELDEFMNAYVRKFPNAIEQRIFVMKHPFRDKENSEIIGKGQIEVNEVAREMKFFNEHVSKLNEEYLQAAGGKLESGKKVKFRDSNIIIRDHHLKVPIDFGFYYATTYLYHDVNRRVVAILGPIGSYEIEE